MSDPEKEVLDELGVTPEGQQDSAMQDAAGAADNAPAEPNNRQKRRARNQTKAKKAEEEAAAAARAREEEEKALGVVTDVVVKGDISDIPTDSAGNPLWFFNAKTRRVVPANAVLVRRYNDGLIKHVRPCAAPKQEQSAA